MNRPQNRVALMTGASAGIGCATARLFADDGAKVVVGHARTLTTTSEADGR